MEYTVLSRFNLIAPDEERMKKFQAVRREKDLWQQRKKQQ